MRSTSRPPTSRVWRAHRSPAPRRTTSSRSTCRAAPTCSRPHPRCASPAISSPGVCRTPLSGIPSTSARTTCRRPEPRPCRRSHSRWQQPSRFSIPCATRASCRPIASPMWWGASPSSSTPASGSSRKSARCARSRNCGTKSRRSVTACRMRPNDVSVTACRSTPSVSPKRSRRTTCSALCWRCSASHCPRTLALAPCSCRRGTRRSDSRDRGTSSGRCACSKYWHTKQTYWSTRTSSTALM